MHCVAKKLVHPDLTLQEREESKKLHNELNDQKEKDEYQMW